MSTEDVRETELHRKIRNSLKRHPEKPVTTVRSDGSTVTSRGIMARIRAVALECNCSVGAVQQVEIVERAHEQGKQANEQRLDVVPFNTEPPADVAEASIKRLVADFKYDTEQSFPGWVVAFGKLSMMINAYLQVARVTGASMPAAWLQDMRDRCENAQTRSERDAQLKKLWPNGAPAGSGNFGDKLGQIEHSE